jgi:hypothetical protein
VNILPKFLQDEERKAYQERLKEFMRYINPDKPTEEEIEKLKELYLKNREG